MTEKSTYSSKAQRKEDVLKSFFLDDTVSKMTPGKRDFVKKGGRKRQRRILLESMQMQRCFYKFRQPVSV